MSGLGLTFLRRGGLTHPTAGSNYIKFKDEAVFNILMSKGVSSDGVGISKDDVARVTSISTWFQDNKDITSFDELEFFTALTRLESNAFNGCSNLTSLKMPAGLTTLGSSALYNCTSLIYEEWLLPNLTSLGNNALFGVKIKRLIMPSLKTFPSANSYTQNFGNKTYLEELTISGDTTSLSANFADGYSALKTLNVDWSKITNISSSALYNCTSLLVSELNLESLMTLGQNAFFGVKLNKLSLGKLTALPTASQYTQTYGAKSTLKILVIPQGVASVGANSFYGYAALQSLCILATAPPTLANVNAFTNTNNCPIYVPDASVASYQSADVWSGIASRIKPLSEFNG